MARINVASEDTLQGVKIDVAEVNSNIGTPEDKEEIGTVLGKINGLNENIKTNINSTIGGDNPLSLDKLLAKDSRSIEPVITEIVTAVGTDNLDEGSVIADLDGSWELLSMNIMLTINRQNEHSIIFNVDGQSTTLKYKGQNDAAYEIIKPLPYNCYGLTLKSYDENNNSLGYYFNRKIDDARYGIMSKKITCNYSAENYVAPFYNNDGVILLNDTNYAMPLIFGETRCKKHFSVSVGAGGTGAAVYLFFGKIKE